MPYFAMEKMIRLVSEGLFDAKAVRALLQTVSLFSDRIVRGNAVRRSRPCDAIDRRELHATGAAALEQETPAIRQ